jgi:LmbE family N-acetylglucosaminyl deacetylase
LSLLPVDLLVFAPHPDDDAIGAGGVIQQALADRKKVRVVFVTSGDG